MKNVISLGAGVQSSTMALMAAHGEITPMPDFAVFADTKEEPTAVYAWLKWLKTKLPFPVHTVSKGSLRVESLRIRMTKDGRYITRTLLPVYTQKANRDQGKIRSRLCTVDYKIRQIRKAVFRHAQVPRGLRQICVRQWIGISYDERERMKLSSDVWSEHCWPLVERKMTRQDCINWMLSRGYPEPPRSACVFCPFHSDKEWHRLKTQGPEEFAKAVKFERDLQAVKRITDNMESTPYLHRSCQPLDSIDFEAISDGDDSGFKRECVGICGI